jgi:alkylation response protein AidB-like acyl-CoA dehydrogenase
MKQDDVVSADAIIDRVDQIDSVVRNGADDAEQARQQSKPVVDALRSAGVFRMAMPHAWGGPELDVCSQLTIVERIARADASAAWCTTIGSESGFFASYIREDAARKLYPDLDMINAGFVGPAGTLEVCDGGYRLSGRWPFGSGVTHADVIVGGAIVTVNGEPILSQSGRPEHRVAMLPAAQWQILDTWNPVGMAGSGSHDYTINDAFVPEDYTWTPGHQQRTEPLYSWFGLSVASAVGVVLGTAAEAFDVARTTLETKTSNMLGTSARGEPAVRAELARGAAMIGSARSYVYDTLGELFVTLTTGDTLSLDQRAHWAGCVVYTGTTCRDAVQILVDAVGAAALQQSSPLSRQLRDLTMLAQHGLMQKRVWEWAGGLYFGAQPPLPVY